MSDDGHSPADPAEKGEGSEAGVVGGSSVLRPLGPARESERIGSLDAVRGLALLGIFLVNVFSFSDAYGVFADPPAPDWHGHPWDALATVGSHLFCYGKFYPLFSMLFGIGLVLQTSRAERSGRDVAPVYLRRQASLTLIGFLHGALLWYGDILFLYGICGTIAFLCRRMRAPALAYVGAGLLAFAVLVGAGSGIGELPEEQPAASGVERGTSPELPGLPDIPGVPGADGVSQDAGTPGPYAMPEAHPGDGPVDGPVGGAGGGEGLAIRRLHQQYSAWERFNPGDAGWIALEREAYREGPYSNALGFRFLTWVQSIGFSLFDYGWHVLAMFFFGMALGKAEVFAPGRRSWHVVMAGAGLLAGFPLSAVGLYAMSIGSIDANVLGTALTLIGGPLMSLGYLGSVTLLVQSGRAGLLTRALGNVGRMGLTNYLLQTVAGTFVFYHWGLARFGTFSPVECVLLVFGVYLAQVVLSAVWMRFFRFGPVEWAWRSLTYLKLQPMAKNA